MFFSKVELRPEMVSGTQLAALIGQDVYSIHQLLWDLFTETSRTFLFRQEPGKRKAGRKSGPVYYLLSQTLPKTDSPLFCVETKPYAPRLHEGMLLDFRLRANPVVARSVRHGKRGQRHDVAMDAKRHCLQHLLFSGKETGPSVATGRMRERVVERMDGNMREKLHTLIEAQGGACQGYENNRALLDLALQTVAETALIQWLIRKGEKNGFSIPENGAGNPRLTTSGYLRHGLPRKGRDAGFVSVDYQGTLEVTDANRFSAGLFSGIGPGKAFGCGLLMIRRAAWEVP